MGSGYVLGAEGVDFVRADAEAQEAVYRAEVVAGYDADFDEVSEEWGRELLGLVHCDVRLGLLRSLEFRMSLMRYRSQLLGGGFA